MPETPKDHSEGPDRLLEALQKGMDNSWSKYYIYTEFYANALMASIDDNPEVKAGGQQNLEYLKQITEEHFPGYTLDIPDEPDEKARIFEVIADELSQLDQNTVQFDLPTQLTIYANERLMYMRHNFGIPKRIE
jgi:hypothetical protein